MLNMSFQSADICFVSYRASLHDIVRFSHFFMLDPTSESESAAESSWIYLRHSTYKRFKMQQQ